MNFPSISFFYKINAFYSEARFAFLCDYYFKLHNILFTNLYIRIYRYKLTKLQKKNNKINIQEKYKKIDRDLFSDKIKKKKRSFIKRKMNMDNAELNKRNFSYSLSLFYSSNEHRVNTGNKREYNKQQRSRKKKNYVYVNKFKDCGNQYNFDPFYPGTTYRLSEYNFYRTKKIKKRNIVLPKPKIDLSIFDTRLGDANFKYFNNYLFNLLLEVYNNKDTNKKDFLLALKSNNLFYFNFLRFLKRRISYIRIIILNFKKVLRNYIYKLNLFNQSLILDKETLSLFLSYLKLKNSFIFKLYIKLLNNYNIAFARLEKANNVSSIYTDIYNSLFLSIKKRQTLITGKKKKKSSPSDFFKKVNRAEKLHSILTNLHANSMRFFNIKEMHKWEKKKIKTNVYVSINQYITLYRSLFKYYFLKDHFSNNAIIYIKATATNVYLYFIYGNKLLFKKSCGELPDVKKKERRFWRNIYPLVESFLPFLVQMKAKYKFPFVSLYLNGSSSLCTPLISRMRKHNKKFRRIIYFLFNEMDFFYNKTLEIKDKYRNRYNFYPVYRLKFYSILDGFNRLSKIFFAINKVKDITSWPYNGCKKKKKKNVR
jgi:hypothetical protein